jgi:hypothetical protein
MVSIYYHETGSFENTFNPTTPVSFRSLCLKRQIPDTGKDRAMITPPEKKRIFDNDFYNGYWLINSFFVGELPGRPNEPKRKNFM